MDRPAPHPVGRFGHELPPTLRAAVGEARRALPPPGAEARAVTHVSDFITPPAKPPTPVKPFLLAWGSGLLTVALALVLVLLLWVQYQGPAPRPEGETARIDTTVSEDTRFTPTGPDPRRPMSRERGPRAGTLEVGEGEYLELVSLEVRVRIQGAHARTEVVHHFHNPQERPRDGMFHYPVPKGARPDHFAVYREPAPDRLPPTRTHLPEVRDQRFRTFVSPIPPRGDLHIVFAYEQPLGDAGGRRVYHFPLPGEGLREMRFRLTVREDECVDPVLLPAGADKVVTDGHVRYEWRWDRSPGGEVVFSCRPAGD